MTAPRAAAGKLSQASAAVIVAARYLVVLAWIGAVAEAIRYLPALAPSNSVTSLVPSNAPALQAEATTTRIGEPLDAQVAVVQRHEQRNHHQQQRNHHQQQRNHHRAAQSPPSGAITTERHPEYGVNSDTLRSRSVISPTPSPQIRTETSRIGTESMKSPLPSVPCDPTRSAS